MPRDAGRAAIQGAPERRRRRPPRPLRPGPPWTGTRTAQARIVARSVTISSGPFQDHQSRYSAGSLGSSTAPRKPRGAEGEFERARSRDRAAYSSGENGWRGGRGIRAAAGPAPAVSAPRGGCGRRAGVRGSQTCGRGGAGGRREAAAASIPPTLPFLHEKCNAGKLVLGRPIENAT